MSADQSNERRQPFIEQADRPDPADPNQPGSGSPVDELINVHSGLRECDDLLFKIIIARKPRPDLVAAPEGGPGLPEFIRSVTTLRDQVAKLHRKVSELQQNPPNP
jgi:hypothetical protein